MNKKAVWTSKSYWMPVLAAIVLAYPKFLTTYIVGIDDLKPGYVDDGILHGRPTNVISNWLLFPDKNVIQPFSNIFGLMLLVLGVTALCAFWQRFAPERLSPLVLGLFSALFITYPMTYELTSYNNLIITTGEGLLLIVTALACLHRYEVQKQKRDFLLAVLCLGLSAGGYESHAALFITLVIATFWLEWETSANVDTRIRDQLRRAVPYILALGGGLVFKWLLGNAMALALRGQLATGNGANNFGWDLRHPVATLTALAKDTFVAYGLFVLEYLPLGILWLAILLGALRILIGGGYGRT